MTDQILRRTRLLASLIPTGTQLTVISAPSGYGKTALVRSWVAENPGVKVIWIPVSREICTRHGFWQRVVATARRHEQFADTGSVIESLLAHTDPVPVLIDFLGGRPSRCSSWTPTRTSAT